MQFATVLLVAIVLMMMVELSETRGRIGRSRRSRSKGSSSKPKITKYTPIKATSVRSPVIVSQTHYGSRSITFKKVVFANSQHRHPFSSAPVYRMGYPMYRSYVSIPKKRAVRVTYERERLLDDNGNLCLDTSAGSQTLKEGIRTTTWLNWQLQWSTKMGKRKHYTESTKQCRWKTSRIKTLKL